MRGAHTGFEYLLSSGLFTSMRTMTIEKAYRWSHPACSTMRVAAKKASAGTP